MYELYNQLFAKNTMILTYLFKTWNNFPEYGHIDITND